MSLGPHRLVFLVLFVVNCVLWSQSRYANVRGTQHIVHTEGSLVRRIALEWQQGPAAYDAYDGHEKECRPLAFPPPSQCQHVQESCPDSDTFLSINYLRRYFCTEQTLRPAAFIGLLLWLTFVFSTLGISAADFFTPNLQTIAKSLGLDDNVAGVTFLALGNGSPDVFSTFSAMRAQSGSLAIGELIGAASFIVSCVVGSMCIIKPFQVERVPFLRDVGFFTVAVGLALVILWDSKIRPWESLVMIGLYIFYVLMVMTSSWWERRQEKKRRANELLRSEYQDEDAGTSSSNGDPYRDDPSPPSSRTISLQVPSPRARAISAPGPPPLGLQTTLPLRPRSRAPSISPSSHRHSQIPSFSLIGAIEFRHAVTGLEAAAAGSSLSIFESPITPYAGGHYYHTRPNSRPHSPSRELDPWDAALGTDRVQMHPRTQNHYLVPPNEELHPMYAQSDGSDEPGYARHNDQVPAISISHTPASPTLSSGDAEPALPPTRRQRVLRLAKTICFTACPSLHHFSGHSPAMKIGTLFTAPALVALTLTLPVVVDRRDQGTLAPEKKPRDDNRLIDFEEEGIERVLIAEQETMDEIHGAEKFNKPLTVVQCVAGPVFCAAVLFSGTEAEFWILLAAAIGGLAAAILVAIFADKGNNPTGRMARCSVGFLVAVVWIMAIADEVVNVLQTFGFIFGLSDAIIGLTVFAVGNSLADFVANMTVAAVAPIMGFSACFGGPMLNILLGVGVSGSYIIQQTGEPYPLHFSKTLMTSTIGLLLILIATLLFVPFNDYFLSRRWGVFLVASYTLLMCLNIFVELRSY